MVIGPTTRDDWEARLSHLRRRVDALDEGPVWLWRIRIRILTFLVARYGSAGERVDEPAVRRPRRAFRRGDAGDVVVEHPPRPAAEIRPIVADLHAVNQQRRFVQAVGRPDLAAIWTWYASTQADRC